jgi:pimeloyl-ACP methyl ester carboxylesterase
MGVFESGWLYELIHHRDERNSWCSRHHPQLFMAQHCVIQKQGFTQMHPSPYAVQRPSRSFFVELRGLRHHVLEWGDAAMTTPSRPTLLMQHGWMDVAASFQFVVDALPTDRHVLAFDWRGFGHSARSAAATYWYADYLADLDAALDVLFFNQQRHQLIDLLGHSMGGNVAMIYAGLRPERVRRLVNLEGFGMPATQATQAPSHYVRWLDELKLPAELRIYNTLDGVVARLRKTNPLLTEQRAVWLAQRWSQQRADGRFEILADPIHIRSNPTLYQVPEALECWKRITAPTLCVEGDQPSLQSWWGARYTQQEFHERLSVVANLQKHQLSQASHMLHHDQPEALAALLEAFLES